MFVYVRLCRKMFLVLSPWILPQIPNQNILSSTSRKISSANSTKIDKHAINPRASDDVEGASGLVPQILLRYAHVLVEFSLNFYFHKCRAKK
jgi:hypothetical protein